MSSKRISKTVIEPARTNSYKYSTKTSTRNERRATNDALHDMLFDEELIEGEVLPKRRPERIAQNDKLNPLKRWIRSHVGQKWDDIYSKMRKTFDFRTIPGLHVVGHLLDYVDRPSSPILRYWTPEFFVDEGGVLRHQPKPKKLKFVQGPKQSEVIKWFGNRLVKQEGADLWWFGSKKVKFDWVACSHFDYRTSFFSQNYCCPYKRKNIRTKEWNFVREALVEKNTLCCFQPLDPARRIRLRELTTKEVKFWNSLTDKDREKHTFHPYDV
jgi:hypothetical protein